MKRIYSKIDPTVLLHAYMRAEDITEERTDISPVEEFLQVSTFKINEGKTYRPHKHIPCKKVVSIPQECWVILTGSVLVQYYDLDDKIIEEVKLTTGDITVTYRGGHNYKCLRKNSYIVEIKTPNYTGQADDKVFIDV